MQCLNNADILYQWSLGDRIPDFLLYLGVISPGPQAGQVGLLPGALGLRAIVLV